jgi:hypothetical protein
VTRLENAHWNGTSHASYAYIVDRTSTISNADRAKDEGGRMKDDRALR